MMVTRDKKGGVFEKRAVTTSERAALDRERSILSEAAHPGVVEVLASDGGEHPSAVAFRLVDGGDLTGLGRQPLEVVAGIGAALATTIADLHSIGVFHLAVRADHVLLDREGRPILCGFGSARRALTPREKAEYSTTDVRGLAALLLDLLPEGSCRRVRSLLRTAVAHRRRRSVDARTLASRLVNLVPGARLPADPEDTEGSASRSPDHATSWRRDGGVFSPVRRPRVRSSLVATFAAAIACVLGFGPAIDTRGGQPVHSSVDRLDGLPCPAVDRGCRTYPLNGEPASFASDRYQVTGLGAGALVVFGRWRCRGDGTPVAIDVATGDVWLFTTLPTPGGRDRALFLTRVPSPTSAVVVPSRSGCDSLLVTERRGRTVIIRPGGPR
jgi:serine/threonine protein kinase